MEVFDSGRDWEECEYCRDEVAHEKRLLRLAKMNMPIEDRAVNDFERKSVAMRLQRHREEVGHTPLGEQA